MVTTPLAICSSVPPARLPHAARNVKSDCKQHPWPTSTTSCTQRQGHWWSYAAPALIVYIVPAPVVEHIAPAPAQIAVPAPVVEYISSAPAASYAALDASSKLHGANASGWGHPVFEYRRLPCHRCCPLQLCTPRHDESRKRSQLPRLSTDMPSAQLILPPARASFVQKRACHRRTRPTPCLTSDPDSQQQEPPTSATCLWLEAMSVFTRSFWSTLSGLCTSSQLCRATVSAFCSASSWSRESRNPLEFKSDLARLSSPDLRVHAEVSQHSGNFDWAPGRPLLAAAALTTSLVELASNLLASTTFPPPTPAPALLQWSKDCTERPRPLGDDCTLSAWLTAFSPRQHSLLALDRKRKWRCHPDLTRRKLQLHIFH